MEETTIKEFHHEKGRISIKVIAIRIGNDLALTTLGGEAPHIGSVVLSTPRPSLNKPDEISSTSSVMNVISHKDETALRMISEKVAASLGCLVSITGGIHVDDITEEEIKDVINMVNEITKDIILKFQSS